MEGLKNLFESPAIPRRPPDASPFVEPPPERQDLAPASGGHPDSRRRHLNFRLLLGNIHDHEPRYL